uniref:AlNc14C241G9476 protein n=1 Tax=Albugo laibachii Nc14 TaxID=890382 RepID=F0WSY7_9STRA|nr:AlNc14C241G9476 [Albugo laibachii Nc14]|eukprot:CCA24471.1 AlNc14C241G9476 [Albugo laibachii Nc14]
MVTPDWMDKIPIIVLFTQMVAKQLQLQSEFPDDADIHPLESEIVMLLLFVDIFLGKAVCSNSNALAPRRVTEGCVCLCFVIDLSPFYPKVFILSDCKYA